jgi:hypothetical protein
MACRRLTRNGAPSIAELSCTYGMSWRCARLSCTETSNRLGVDEITVAHQTLRGIRASGPKAFRTRKLVGTTELLEKYVRQIGAIGWLAVLL